MTIRLLVSVRNPEEAEIAVDGGADIIDVKEPHHGSLGFAGVETLERVIASVGGRAPVSAALGECIDWLGGERDNPIVPALPAGLSYTKLGIAKLAAREPHWSLALNSVRQEFVDVTPMSSTEKVAVAYADFELANAPAPQDVLAMAIQARDNVFLIDTYQKDQRTTFDWLPAEQLECLRKTARAAGVLFALAGRLTEQHLPQIRHLSPDILGVRGAVCRESDRTGPLCAARVTALKSALRK